LIVGSAAVVVAATLPASSGLAQTIGCAPRQPVVSIDSLNRSHHPLRLV